LTVLILIDASISISIGEGRVSYQRSKFFGVLKRSFRPYLVDAVAFVQPRCWAAEQIETCVKKMVPASRRRRATDP